MSELQAKYFLFRCKSCFENEKLVHTGNLRKVIQDTIGKILPHAAKAASDEKTLVIYLKRCQNLKGQVKLVTRNRDHHFKPEPTEVTTSKDHEDSDNATTSTEDLTASVLDGLMYFLKCPS